MTQVQVESEIKSGQKTDVDVVVVGAGFSGLCMLHMLREAGFTAQVFEAGDGVGGTWFWNRYPGARVDLQSVEYSFSFAGLQDEWDWTELMAPQPELEAYLNWVADRLDLRRDIKLSSRVTAATYDELSATWSVETDRGDRVVSRFVIAATGCLSAPLEPDIEGLKSFAGVTLFTSRFPKEGFDFSGKRVGVVGTGSSGVQVIPIIAKQAAELVVFQRSAAFTLPADVRKFEPGEFEALRADYPSIRQREREHRTGSIFTGALGPALTVNSLRNILELSPEERLAAIDEFGWLAATVWLELQTNLEANAAAVEIYAELVRRTVKDPETAKSLVPLYPFGCKRLIIDDGYYETFNRPNVKLVDLRKGGIQSITPTGVVTEQRTFDLDVLVLATGFDAITGALRRIDISGRDGRLLRDYWDAEGPISYLGLQVVGFPNFFTMTGPGSPSVLSNVVASIEQHAEWITETLVHLRQHDHQTIEPTEDAALEWVDYAAKYVEGTVRIADSCTSWYVGANVPGKRRVHMPFNGGLHRYRKRCAEIAADGYQGFVIK